MTCNMPTVRFSQLVWVWGLALALAGEHAWGDGTSFQDKPATATVEKHANWMARLPDSHLLSQLSLPGTHDTCALYNGFSFGFAKCQAWALADQLNAGIRFIDIRCRHLGDRFAIYHGVIDQRISFDDVRAWLGTQEAIVATPHSQRSVAEVCVKLDGEIGEFPFLPLIDALELVP